VPDDTGWGEAQHIIERQADQIAVLSGECHRLANDLARVGPPAHDFIEVLRYPGVRRAVLKALHRDSHAGIGESEARAFDQRFQKASAVFDRLETD
jgi:hypothetical protein